MPGAFGLLDDVCHDRVPNDRLVEAHAVLDVHVLHREGLLVPGVEARLGDGGYFRTIPEAGKVEIDGQQIRVAWHPALPLRCFTCPSCGRDAYKLHSVGGVWACRQCHLLTYSSRHRCRTIPGLSRLRYLRRRIGASAEPFSPLPANPKPRTSVREHLRLAREIRRLEQALIEHGRRDVCEVLEKRYARS